MDPITLAVWIAAILIFLPFALGLILGILAWVSQVAYIVMMLLLLTWTKLNVHKP